MWKDSGKSEKERRIVRYPEAAPGRISDLNSCRHDKMNSAGKEKQSKSEKKTIVNAYKERRKRRHGIRDKPMQDYREYHFSVKEGIKGVAVYVVLDTVVSYLFFNSIAAFAVLLPGIFLFLKEYRQELARRRAREMRQQFLDGMQMTAASLQAGYSIENAFHEAWKELGKIYGQDTFIIREFRHLVTQTEMNRNVEELLNSLGQRSGIEDIKSFAEVFETAKRTGGDLLAVIRNTVSCMRQRQETLAEIETCLAGKVMEQNVMSVVPILILAYVRLSSPEFLASMYGNVTGTAVMTICFGVYLAAWFWGRKIVRIEV